LCNPLALRLSAPHRLGGRLHRVLLAGDDAGGELNHR